MKHRFSILLLLPLAFILYSLVAVTVTRWMPVYVTPLMVERSIAHRSDDSFHTRHKWVPLERISPEMAKAVIASEDNRFESHHGFDFDELRKMADEHRTKGKRIRGCSTISQQTAKNCFTFCTDTWARKALEVWWTFLIERIWGKERIMEVYLNVAEMGVGVYGAEAAANVHFNCTAKELNRRQCALIAACLPNPLKRDPAHPTAYLEKRQRQIISLERNLSYPDWIDE